ncbi:Na(+)/citrate cotransporter-like [Babylonia areolata]|uniref:Na(+)/citrate cotransporter-like n=1 Tax=Babylonia areolata TaxID=304850 RepID=UPI003FCF24FC
MGCGCGGSRMAACLGCLKSFLDSKTLWMSILIPLAASPLPILYPTTVAKAGYCVIVVGLFWVTEIIPLAVTSLFPVFLFPMFGIMTAKDVCMSYVKDTLMLFLGSLIVAVAVERWDLHRRLALRTLTLVGPEPRWLMLGIMFPCYFLSMWMSNTATTAMMMPILNAILAQIRQSRRARYGATETEIMMKNSNEKHDEVANDTHDMDRLNERGVEEGEGEEEEEEEADEEFNRLAKVFALCIAFSANIGGVATLTGTPPNVIFKGMADALFQTHGAVNPINFASWLIMGLPLSFICFVFCWLWMQLYGQGIRCFRCCTKDNSFAAVKRTLHEEYVKLGSMTFAEVLVLINFIIMALLWVTRNPGFIPGWSYLFEKGYVRDSTPAILISVLLFILPARVPRWLKCGCTKSAAINDALNPDTDGYLPLLSWKIVKEKMAWGVLLLMGGGFALADGCQVSGLSQWVSSHLNAFGDVPPWITALVLSLFIAVATEVTSNAATTTLFAPIAGDLAVQLGVNPLYFMIPVTVSASLAFLLPVATPPNAIVFASGYLRVRDMFLVGLPINIFALVAINLAINSWAVPAYGLLDLPFNASLTSTTASALNTSTTTTVSLQGLFPYLNAANNSSLLLP